MVPKFILMVTIKTDILVLRVTHILINEHYSTQVSAYTPGHMSIACLYRVGSM